MSSVPSLHEATVRNERGQKIGTVHAVYTDAETGNPAWAAVKLGALHRRRHIIPLHGTYRSADGDLVVPFDKDTITASPLADEGVPPSQTDASLLARHFDLDHTLDVGQPETL